MSLVPRPSRIVAAALAAAIAIAAPLALAPGAVAAPQGEPLSAVTDDGAAWSVATVDGEQGNGRPNYSYGLSAGGTVEDLIRVTNTGTTDLHLRMYAADAFTTAEGGIDILESSEKSTDAGLWVEPETEYIDLAPGESTEVGFTVKVPADAVPGDHSAALVASLLPEGDGQVQVERRLGLRVSIRVAGQLTAEVAFSDVHSEYVTSLNPFAPAKIRTTYTVENIGNTRIRVDEAVRVHGLLALGTRVTSTAVDDLLPGSSVQVTREVPTLAIGGANVEVSATALPFDGSVVVPEPFTAQSQVAGAPWSFLVLVIVVLAAAAIATVLIIRRRRENLYFAYLARERETQQAEKEGALT